MSQTKLEICNFIKSKVVLWEPELGTPGPAVSFQGFLSTASPDTICKHSLVIKDLV